MLLALLGLVPVLVPVPVIHRAVRRGIIPGRTKLVIVESPTNPRMQICDIKAICDMARAAGAICCVDNRCGRTKREHCRP